MNSTRSKRRGSTTTTPGCTVRAYFLEQMDDSDKRRVVRAYPAIDCLERFLGRTALLKDLSDKTLAAFFDWLSESAGLGQETISCYQRKILTIGRHAAERSIIDHPMPTWECRVPRDSRTSDDNGWLCLCRYFDEVYLADHSQLTAETLKAYRSAIRCFERFVKDRPAVNCVSQRMIKQFRQWLLDNGFNAKKAGNNAFAVAAVVKHARPERFLEEAAELDPAVDPERALEYVFTNTYLPAKLKIASDKTAMKYVATFRSFGRFLGHIATLDDLTDENLGRWMRSIRGEGRAARTANGYRSKLIAIWNWCARKRIVENFPTVEKMPEPLTLPCAWTGDQLRSLMAACYRTNGTIADIPAGYWWSALHLGRDADAVADTLWDAFETNAGGNKTGNNRSDSHSESAEKKPQTLVGKRLTKVGPTGFEPATF